MENPKLAALATPLALAASYFLNVQLVFLPGPWWLRLLALPVLAAVALAANLTFAPGTEIFAITFPRIALQPKNTPKITMGNVELPRRRLTAILVAVFLGTALAALSMFRAGSDLDQGSLGLDPGQIVECRGELAKDSWISGKGDEIICLVSLKTVSDKLGHSANTSMLVRLSIVNDNIPRPAGTVIVASVAGLDPAPDRTWQWYARGVETERTKPGWLLGVRARIVTAIDKALSGCESRVRGFALALLLGRQDQLTDDMSRAFYRSGCAHLVALSGMHIALIGMLLIRLFLPLFGAIPARLLALAGTCFFIWIAGPYPSALRALSMFAHLQVCRIVGYRMDILTSLCLSVPILGLIDPILPLSLGFLLSFGALGGLLLLEKVLRKGIVRVFRPTGAKELAAGIAANLGTLPLIGLRNMAFYPQGLIAGIALGPPVLAFMGIAALQVVWGLFFPQTPIPGTPFVLEQLYRFIAWLGGVFAS